VNLRRFQIFTAVLLLGELSYCAFALGFFHKHGAFPAPIYLNASDSFMDLYHTVFWSWNEGRFEKWHSIYPMFVFMLGKLFSNPACVSVATDAFQIRECNPGAFLYLVLAYLIGAFVSALIIIRTLDSELKGKLKYVLIVAWTLIVLFSVSGLFALERGNFIIFAFLFLALATYFKTDWRSVVFFALAISVKQYLVVLLIVPFLNKNYKYVFLVLLGMVIANLVALFYVPEAHFDLLFQNMLGFATTKEISIFDKIWFPTSISSYSRVLNSEQALNLGHGINEVVKPLLNFFLWVVRAVFVAGILRLFFSNNIKSEAGNTFLYLLIGMLCSTDSLGGYAIILLFPFLGKALKSNSSFYCWLLIFALLVPLEIPFWPSRYCDNLSYLSGLYCNGSIAVSLWSYVRPMVLILILFWMTFQILIPKKFSTQS
jgi:hypothetical protein